MIATLKYYMGDDCRLRRIVTYRDLFNIEYRIKVFPVENRYYFTDDVNPMKDTFDHLNLIGGKTKWQQ